jgi:hypothetical protein
VGIGPDSCSADPRLTGDANVNILAVRLTGDANVNILSVRLTGYANVNILAVTAWFSSVLPRKYWDITLKSMMVLFSWFSARNYVNSAAQRTSFIKWRKE